MTTREYILYLEAQAKRIREETEQLKEELRKLDNLRAVKIAEIIANKGVNYGK